MVIKYLKSQNFSENFKKFIRFQLTALIATSIDFFITILLKEYFHQYYTLAVGVGACAGALAAFTVNRYWVFRSLERNPLGQGFRYLIIAMGSVILNTAGTYILTESINISYIVSKAIVALIIGFTYSFYFSKRFVFYA